VSFYVHVLSVVVHEHWLLTWNFVHMYQTKFQSDLILGQSWKHKKCYDSWTNDWITLTFLSEVYLERLHDIIHMFLILRTFEEVKLHLTWSSSVSMARFVTAGAIDLNLCTYVPLGKSSSQATFQFSLILGLATRGTKSAITPEIMSGSKFLSLVHLIRIHDILPGFLIWPTFEGYRGKSSKWYR
jgi:hypothetical protein